MLLVYMHLLKNYQIHVEGIVKDKYYLRNYLTHKIKKIFLFVSCCSQIVPSHFELDFNFSNSNKRTIIKPIWIKLFTEQQITILIMHNFILTNNKSISWVIKHYNVEIIRILTEKTMVYCYLKIIELHSWIIVLRNSWIQKHFLVVFGITEQKRKYFWTYSWDNPHIETATKSRF